MLPVPFRYSCYTRYNYVLVLCRLRISTYNAGYYIKNDNHRDGFCTTVGLMTEWQPRYAGEVNCNNGIGFVIKVVNSTENQIELKT